MLTAGTRFAQVGSGRRRASLEQVQWKSPTKAPWCCCNWKPVRCWPYSINSALMPSRGAQTPEDLQTRSTVTKSTNTQCTSLTDAARSLALGQATLMKKAGNPLHREFPALVGRLRTVVWWRWAESNRRPEALHPQHYMLSPPLDLVPRQHGWQSAPGNQPALSDR
ncbi:hypothetical protein XAP7430_260169 [Xanthomonas phaseoli pv. phaseoli]|uniref:Uncharacterized protein n=1 Tax=Xanthomonas campestris pv. phaseoli TaxID=317013 RepID=A0AB38DZQ1_XANCH|nr:hypothetical protein XAP7430_260169 [Xanthomonas phaseoli pv. phaseoli]